MTPSSALPLRKVSYSTLAGLLTALLFWALRRYAGVEIDPEGTAIITSLVAGLVGYMTPLAPGEIKVRGSESLHRKADHHEH